MSGCILNRCCGALLCAIYGGLVTLLMIAAVIAITICLASCTPGIEPLMPTH